MDKQTSHIAFYSALQCTMDAALGISICKLFIQIIKQNNLHIYKLRNKANQFVSELKTFDKYNIQVNSCHVEKRMKTVL